MTPQNERFAAATRLVENNVMGSMAIGLIPVPAVDVAGLFTQQLYMLKGIGVIYGEEISAVWGRRTIAAFFGGLVPTALFLPTASLIRVVPVVGNFVALFTMPMLAGTATYALGKVFIDHFESGGTALTLNPAKMRENFRRYYKEGEKFVAAKGSPAESAVEQSPQPMADASGVHPAPPTSVPHNDGSGDTVTATRPPEQSPLPVQAAARTVADERMGSANPTPPVGAGARASVKSGPDYNVGGSEPTNITESGTDTATKSDVQAAASAASSYDKAVLEDKPFAYWKLDETSGTTVADATSNDNEGNIHGGVTMGQPGAIAGSTAPVFDGSTGYLEFGGFWGGGEEVTVEAWVKVSQTSDDFQAVVSALGEEFVQLQLHSSGTINVYTDTGTASLPIVPQTPTGAWRHVALVVASGKSRVYVNGNQVGSSDATFSSIKATPVIRVGSGLDRGRFFRGQIDRVAIYEKVLSPVQIQAHVKAAGKGVERAVTRDPTGGDFPDQLRKETTPTILGVGADHLLYTRQTLTSPWVQIPDSGSVIDAVPLPDGKILGVGTDNMLYTRETLTSKWVLVPNSGAPAAIAIMPDGKILCVGKDRRLYTRDTLTSAWVLIPNSGSMTSVAVLPDGKIVGAGADNQLYTRDTLTSSWMHIRNSGATATITALEDGTILCVGMNGKDLYTRATPTSGWVLVPSSDPIIGLAALKPGIKSPTATGAGLQIGSPAVSDEIAPDSANWGVRCWDGKLWRPHPLDEMKWHVDGEALVALNTSRRHSHALLTYLPKVVDGEFTATGEIRGTANTICVLAGDGRDATVSAKPPHGTAWHRFVFQRSGGAVSVTLDGAPVDVHYHNTDAALAGRFAISIFQNKQCEIRHFELTTPQPTTVPAGKASSESSTSQAGKPDGSASLRISKPGKSG